eukprot:TRINITY_DN19398_c0_g1_i1.p1 TRINITY_DN19398_c0_g1~~TRINITY_DN19398_c0_g1_i1.p1  ORF type:complete len:321 (-),score=36.76 TRINITY_DN19398_c0_g1_i1:266-1192(-)
MGSSDGAPVVPARRGRSMTEAWLNKDTFIADPFGVREVRSMAFRWQQFIFALLMMFACIYFNCVAQAYLQQAMGDYYQRGTKLYDFFFVILPHVKKSHYADWIVYGLNALVALRFYIIPGPRSLRIAILQRWMLCFGILFLLRGFSIFCTVLPNPDSTCVPQIKYPDNIWLEAWRLVAYQDLTCQDVLYSGHTVHITLCCLIWFEYSPRAPWSRNEQDTREYLIETMIIPFVSVLVGIFSYGFIIATHFHYTVDVFLGSCMTIFVFKGYHAAMRLAPFRQHKYFYQVVGWLEQDAADLVMWLEKAKED